MLCSIAWFLKKLMKNTRLGLQGLSAAEDDDLIGFEDGMAVFVKDDQLVPVFLADLLPEFAYACFLALRFQSVMGVHPSAENGRRSRWLAGKPVSPSIRPILF
jgi:hypothetical protein